MRTPLRQRIANHRRKVHRLTRMGQIIEEFEAGKRPESSEEDSDFVGDLIQHLTITDLVGWEVAAALATEIDRLNRRVVALERRAGK